MRQIASAAGLSVGNLYHHFGSKETIFERLIDDYLGRVQEPDSPLQQIFQRAAFPDDLEEMAEAIGGIVEHNATYIKLIYIDVIEFEGVHIRSFYEAMAGAFSEAYSENFARKTATGKLGDIDPLVAVMFATRWFFYFFTVERCFGVPMHFGMTEHQAVHEFIRILRNGVLPRSEAAAPKTSRPQNRRGRTK
jgi:AcrR family transcriptional regulator